MHMLHIEEASIVLLLNDTLDIVRAWRVRRSYCPPSCVVRLRALLSTPCGKPTISDGYFTTDGLGCVRLLWWIINERPHATAITIRNRFDALFADNPNDAVLAALRVFDGSWEAAPGEQAFFVNEQWDHHPREMAALAVIGTFQPR